MKETDRISCMACELAKMGVKVEELPDGLVVYAGPIRACRNLKSYGDHRIVMALAVAALAADGVSLIDEAEMASVTYPGFVADFRAMGAGMELI